MKKAKREDLVLDASMLHPVKNDYESFFAHEATRLDRLAEEASAAPGFLRRHRVLV